MTIKVLLVGESWVSSATHYKGFDQFGSVTFHLGAEPLVAALQGDEFDITYMTAHDSVEKFPFSLEELSAYQVIILSDIGANSLLLPPAVWLHGKPVVNRLKIIRDWTAAGGGLVMAGGYFSFQGIDGKARWRRTPVEEALPVACLPYDDRLEIPEGFRAVVRRDHEILAGVGGDWPLLLGANEVVAKDQPDVEVIATLPDSEGGHPLLVTGKYGNGRTVAWTSDIGPHWLPNEFVAWPGYATLWKNILRWVNRAA
ncbi:glutamine amidotransferase [Rhizobium sp. 60-20]|uniref:glutamine amidotransferase n=1 Tax=Rhizobium sp. 60-20 TaxID=1895819 RepID=UPI00092AE41A|nr:glutamine amidotransferase [Rhizobium sp. 60-20]MBN8952454.1 cytoplasmic protein [Rhizobium tropici]OJY78936.1 MAG: cytoplasmic protein [Rhizobium sp. 60-20]